MGSDDAVPDFSEARLKRMALAVCARRKQDPEERVMVAHPAGYAVALYVPRWTLVRDEIREWLHIFEAMVEATTEEDDDDNQR